MVIWDIVKFWFSSLYHYLFDPADVVDFYLFQAKFNTFVLNLRNEYSNKVTTFRQVITIHREDSLRTNTHWEDTVKVMNSKSWNPMIHGQHVYPNGIKHATDI